MYQFEVVFEYWIKPPGPYTGTLGTGEADALDAYKGWTHESNKS